MIESKRYKGRQGVYKITQPDGRFYIGSSVELYNRLRSHKGYFSKNSRDYKKIRYTCEWTELSFEILQETFNLNKKNLKSIEDEYLKKMWCDKILNIEKNSTGRCISNENNPNWSGKKLKNNFCNCGRKIDLRSNQCYSCRAKNRKRDDLKKFI